MEEKQVNEAQARDILRRPYATRLLVDSVFIAVVALALIAMLVAIIAYA